MQPVEAKEWLDTMRAEIGEIAAFEAICDVGLTVCTPSEHIIAHKTAQKVKGVEAEDILGLMVLIGWEICERS